MPCCFAAVSSQPQKQHLYTPDAKYESWRRRKGNIQGRNQNIVRGPPGGTAEDSVHAKNSSRSHASEVQRVGLGGNDTTDMCSVALAVVERVAVGFGVIHTIPVITDEVVAVLDDTVLLVTKAPTKSGVRVVDACVYDSDADSLTGFWRATELVYDLMT